MKLRKYYSTNLQKLSKIYISYDSLVYGMLKHVTKLYTTTCYVLVYPELIVFQVAMSIIAVAYNSMQYRLLQYILRNSIATVVLEYLLYSNVRTNCSSHYTIIE